MEHLIIAIDGPAGSGKSTISRLLAKRLGIQYLDTGAMYRSVALWLKEQDIDIDDEEALNRAIKSVFIEFKNQRVLLNGRDISDLIRTPEIDMLASNVSKIACIRQRLTGLQRKIGQNMPIVAEGRDMGTVVFPDAHFKFFITATPEERAKRRQKQLAIKGETVLYETILYQIKKRDKLDSERKIAPLMPAKNAIIIDTTDKDIEEVLHQILDYIKVYKNGCKGDLL